MEWYNILFFVTLAFFIIKTIISFVFGDIDIDFDADGDVDFDVSSMLSFKGILHFLLGFSTYLAALARFNNVQTFTVTNYIIGIIIGLAFMIMLWSLYKLMMKLNHSADSNEDIDKCKCTVLINLGNCKYKVLVKTNSGTCERIVESDSNDDNIPIGSERTIMKTDNYYWI